MSTVFASITTPGPPGPPGRTALWLTGTVPPVTGQGLDGDMYLNSATGDVYGPKAGVWGGIVANIKGSAGAAGPAGPAGYSPLYIVAAGPPATITGNNGDMYLDNTTAALYGPKTAGVWGASIGNIKGATGATGAQGPPGVAYTPRGAWSSATTYTQGDMVSSAGVAYISLQSANLNNAPLGNPTWWQAVASGGTQTPWNSNIDAGGFKLYNAGGIGIGIGSVAGVPANTLAVHSPTRVATLATFTANDGNPLNLSTPSIGLGVSAAALWGVITGQQRAANTYGEGDLAFSTRTGDTIVERMRILWNGNVGIGTASPQATLHVPGSVIFGASGAFPQPNQTFIDGASGSRFMQFNSAGTLATSINSNAVSYFNGGNVGIGTAAPSALLSLLTAAGTATTLDLTQLGNAKWTISIPASVGALAFSQQTSEFMRITNAGNVGIGTVAPQGKLAITPTANAISVATATQLVIGEQTNSAGFYLSLGYMIESSAWKGSIQAVAQGGVAAPLILNGNGGNVGIGTLSPTYGLEIASQTWPLLRIRNLETASNHVQFRFYGGKAAADTWSLGTDLIAANGGTELSIYSAIAAKIVTTFLQNGNVGIGTTAPSTVLHVNGPSGSPSASAETGVALFQTAALTQLAIGGINGGSYGVWLQTKYISNNGSTWPLMVNPLGGSVIFGGNFAPVRPFHVHPGSGLNFCIGAGPTVANSLAIEALNDAATTNIPLEIRTSATYFASGAVRIGSSTLPGYALDVTGDVNVSGAFRVNGTPISTGSGGGVTACSGNLVGSRAIGVAYQNTSGKPMFITVSVAAGPGNGVTVDVGASSSFNAGTKIGHMTNGGNTSGYQVCSFWVLPNWWSQLSVVNAASLTHWTEWT